MFRTPETRPTLSTMVLGHELVRTENILLNALATVTKVNSSSNDIYICNCITPLKIKTKIYEVANHALVIRNKQPGHVHAAEQWVEVRLGIVHRDSSEVVNLLNSRLIAVGHERCSSLHESSIPEDRDKVPETVDNLTHGCHTNRMRQRRSHCG